jgi:hypothetical protein
MFFAKFGKENLGQTTHFIPKRPLLVNLNATIKDKWGEWQGLGKLTSKTQTF